MANREHRLRFQTVVKVQHIADQVGTEERGTHPASRESCGVNRKQEVLGGSTEALHGHEVLRALTLRIGIRMGVAEVEAGDDHHRRPLQPVATIGQAPFDGDLIEAIQLQLPSPIGGHGGRQFLPDLGFFENDEAPWLRAMRRRCPASRSDGPFDHCHVHRFIRKRPHGRAAPNQIVQAGECIGTHDGVPEVSGST